MTDRDVRNMSNAILALQQQYVKLVDERRAEHRDTLSQYEELCLEVAAKIQVSSKYAKMLLVNKHFQEASEVIPASLYIPILNIVQIGLESHRFLPGQLLQEVESKSCLMHHAQIYRLAPRCKLHYKILLTFTKLSTSL